MNKFAFLFAPLSLFAFEQLEPKYQVAYGNRDAEVEIVEYFSMSCPKCLEFLAGEFPKLKAEYLDTGKASWRFHPNPADLLTLQALVCLELLSEAEKPVFLEAVANALQDTKGKRGSFLMQAAMETFGRPVPELDQLAFLETTEAFKSAFQFLSQPDAVSKVPAVEINGQLLDAYPSAQILGEQMKERLS